MFMITVICDICGNEIIKRILNDDNKLMNHPMDSVNEVQIGNEIVVVDCCNNCASKIKNYIQVTKEHLINEGNLSND